MYRNRTYYQNPARKLVNNAQGRPQYNFDHARPPTHADRACAQKPRTFQSNAIPVFNPDDHGSKCGLGRVSPPYSWTTECDR